MIGISSVLGLLNGGSIKYIAIGIAALSIIGAAYFYVSGYYKAQNEISRLEITAEILRNEIKTQVRLRELETEARKKADQALLALESRVDTIRSDREVIYLAPKENDGSIAPVLRDYLDRLQRNSADDPANRDTTSRNP